MIKIITLIATVFLLTLQATPLLKTGQTLSYDADGNEVTDGSIKDDGYYQAGATRSYTRNNEVVTDNVTGLEWQDNEVITSSWENINCGRVSLDGYGWRLPNIEELKTLIDSENSNPALMAEIFQNYLSSPYWSLTPSIRDTSAAWMVDFSSGNFSAHLKNLNYAVRCVRGEVLDDSNLSRNNVSQIVTDNNTNLQWQDNEEVNTTQRTWTNAIDYCENFSLDGSDWRLPNITELASIINFSTRFPAMDDTTFQNYGYSYYWSSTTSVIDTAKAFSIGFSDGASTYYSKEDSKYIRCVRGGEIKKQTVNIAPIISYLLSDSTPELMDNDDVNGKKMIMSNGDTLSFYSNMTYIENIVGVGQRTGTWSVEEGILIIDVTFSQADKETITLEFDSLPSNGVSITVNKTKPLETLKATISSVEVLTDDVIPSYASTIDMLAGKQLDLGDKTILYLFQNMTTVQNEVTEGSGTWSIANGVLIHDITTMDPDQGTETTAIVFRGPADESGNVILDVYETYSDGGNNDTVDVSLNNPAVLTDIPVDATYHSSFDNDPVPYDVLISDIKGKKITITSNNEVLYFYDNMTYRVTGVDSEDSSSYDIAGTWSIENGVLIADVTMDDTESEARVYVFDSKPNANSTFTGYLTLAGDPVKDENEVIVSIVDID